MPINSKINFQDIINHTATVIKAMSLVDVVEIFILAWIVFILARFVRETRAAQLLKGILLIFIVALFLRQFDFKVLGIFGDTIVNVGVMSAIVMFQPELRRILEKMGRTKLVKTISMNFESSSDDILTCIDRVSTSCEMLSRKAIGALIVIEKDIKLGEQINTGTLLNAVPSEPLFGNIFHPHTPLHDGAVIMRDGLILAAGCFLPKPQNEELISKELGSRHRAAIGLSEVSDAVIIVVSEETGTISIAKDGSLERGFDEKKLHKYLIDELVSAKVKKNKKNAKTPKNPKSDKTNKDTATGGVKVEK